MDAGNLPPPPPDIRRPLPPIPGSRARGDKPAPPPRPPLGKLGIEGKAAAAAGNAGLVAPGASQPKPIPLPRSRVPPSSQSASAWEGASAQIPKNAKRRAVVLQRVDVPPGQAEGSPLRLRPVPSPKRPRLGAQRAEVDQDVAIPTVRLAKPPPPKIALAGDWKSMIGSSALKQDIAITKASIQFDKNQSLTPKELLAKVAQLETTLNAWVEDGKKHFDPGKDPPLASQFKLEKHVEFFHAAKEVFNELDEAGKALQGMVNKASVKKEVVAAVNGFSKAAASAGYELRREHTLALSHALDNRWEPLSAQEVAQRLSTNMTEADATTKTSKTWGDVQFVEASNIPPNVQAQSSPSSKGGTEFANLSKANETVVPSRVMLPGPKGPMSVGRASVANAGKGSANEDRLDARLLQVKGQSIPYMAVFDGHGGSAVAEDLSKNFSTKMQQVLMETASFDDASVYNALDRCCVEYNAQIRAQDPPPTCGACAAISLVINNSLWVINVGDTRVAVVDDSQIRVLSDDADLSKDSYKQAAEGLGGTVTPDGRLTAVGGAVGRLQCPRAFGDCTTPGVSAHPGITKLDLATLGPNSHLVIGCDGLWDHATGEEVAAEVRNGANSNRNMGDIAGSLAWKAANGYDSRNKALSPGGKKAGDDITVMVVPLRS